MCCLWQGEFFNNYGVLGASFMSVLFYIFASVVAGGVLVTIFFSGWVQGLKNAGKVDGAGAAAGGANAIANQLINRTLGDANGGGR